MKKHISFAIFILSFSHIMSLPESPQLSFSSFYGFQKNLAPIIRDIITSPPARIVITASPVIATAHYIPIILAELAPKAGFGGLAFAMIMGAIAGKAGANMGEWLKKQKEKKS